MSSFKKTLLVSIIVSGFISAIIIGLTSKSIPAYEYKLKVVENPEVLKKMIQQDTSLSKSITQFAQKNNRSHDDIIDDCIVRSNKIRTQLLKNEFYKQRKKTKKLGTSHNQLINEICIDSLKIYYKR